MAVLSRILMVLAARSVGRLPAVLALALLAPAFGARAEDSLEKAVKAAYLYKFAPFISWPAATFTGPADPFDICIVGNDPFGSLLDRAVTNQHVDGRAILVHRMPKADRKSSCQIMYIGGPPAAVKEALQAVVGTPVLTVTDGPEAPSVVGFVMDQGRVRFRLNDQTAADNGLAISSKLLSLAVSVTQRKTGGTP